MTTQSEKMNQPEGVKEMKCDKPPSNCHFTMCKTGIVCRLYLFSLPLEERLKMRLRWIPLMENFKPTDLMTMQELRKYKKLTAITPEAFHKWKHLYDAQGCCVETKRNLPTNPLAETKIPLATPYAKRRLMIYHEYKGICWLCEKPVSVDEFSIDHVRPRSKGGTNAIENLRPAHHDCNGIKGHHDVTTSEQFWALILHRDDKKRMVKQKRRLLSEFEKAALYHKINAPFKEPEKP